MKLRVFLLGLLAAALICAPAWAKSQLVSDDLPNGMKVYVLEDHNNPLVALQIWVRTGLVNEDHNTRGMSHFLEHLLFKGTKKRKVGEIDRELDAIGATNNAATYYDYTYYQVTGASCYFNTMLDVETDALTNSALEPAEVEKERKVVVEEIKMGEDTPFRVMYKAIHKSLFDNLPYLYPVIGFAPIIENVPRDVIYKYYKEKYNPKNMFVVVVGDIDPQTAIAKVKDAFKDFTSEAPANEKLNPAAEPPLTKPECQIIKMDTEKTYMAIGFRGVTLDSPEMPVIEVLDAIAGSGNSSRLNQALREKNKLVDMVSNSTWYFRSAGALASLMVLDSKNIEAAKETYFKELEDLKAGNIKDDEIEKAKNMLETSYILAHQNYEGMAEYLGSTIATASVEQYGNYLENIKKVTKDDLVKAANKYYTNGYVNIIVEPQNNSKNIGGDKRGK